MFDNLKTDATIESDGDKLGGSNFAPKESGLYNCTIKLAYGTQSKGKATALNLNLETEDGKEIKEQLWMSSGEAKGCLNYFMAKNPTTGKKDIKKYLPGFELANDLCLMTLNREISTMKDGVDVLDKTIQLYDYSQGKEVPTDVKMVMPLIGQKITVGLIKMVVDKEVMDPASGQYVPSGETREKNEIDKFFHFPSGLTVTEAIAKATEPVFREKWAEKNTGVTVDKTKKTGVAAGAPATGGAAIGGATAPAGTGGSTLFG